MQRGRLRGTASKSRLSPISRVAKFEEERVSFVFGSQTPSADRLQHRVGLDSERREPSDPPGALAKALVGSFVAASLLKRPFEPLEAGPEARVRVVEHFVGGHARSERHRDRLGIALWVEPEVLAAPAALTRPLNMTSASERYVVQMRDAKVIDDGEGAELAAVRAHVRDHAEPFLP